MGIMGTLGIDMRQLSCHILFILTAKIQSFCEKQRVESRKVSCRYVFLGKKIWKQALGLFIATMKGIFLSDYYFCRFPHRNSKIMCIFAPKKNRRNA